MPDLTIHIRAKLEYLMLHCFHLLRHVESKKVKNENKKFSIIFAIC